MRIPCQDYHFRIIDDRGSHVYSVQAPFCQCGIHFSFDCRGCRLASFDIIPVEKTLKSGKILRLNADDRDLSELELNDTLIIFPEDALWNHKGLIISCAMYLEASFFSRTNKIQQN